MLSPTLNFIAWFNRHWWILNRKWLRSVGWVKWSMLTAVNKLSKAYFTVRLGQHILHQLSYKIRFLSIKWCLKVFIHCHFLISRIYLSTPIKTIVISFIIVYLKNFNWYIYKFIWFLMLFLIKSFCKPTIIFPMREILIALKLTFLCKLINIYLFL